MKNDVPTLGYIVDALTARIEHLDSVDSDFIKAEADALREARAVIEAHVFGELRNRSIIALIRDRIARRFAA